MNKWTYKINSNNCSWSNDFVSTKEEAIKKANSQAILLNENEFKVGKVEFIFNYGIDVDYILEDVRIGICEEVGDIADSYLSGVNNDHKEELRQSLNKVFYDWQEKYNYECPYFKVVDCETINVIK